MLVECDALPETPVTASVEVPDATFLLVLIIRVAVAELPDETVTGSGLNRPFANLGRPSTLRLTLPLKPLESMVTVYSVLSPGLMVWLDGDTSIEKSPPELP